MSDEAQIPHSDDDEEAAQVASGAGKTRVKAKKKAGVRGKKSVLTEELWAALRGFYESGDYSQRNLADLARARFGVVVSQSLIARKAGENGWVKGSRIAEIREEVHKQLSDQIGENIRRMLEEQRNAAKIATGEIFMHFKYAAKQRQPTVSGGGGNPDYLIPAALLRQLVGGLNETQQMEARAMGFDIKTGRPFAPPEDETGAKLTQLELKILTPEDEAQIQASLSKIHGNDSDGEDD